MTKIVNKQENEVSKDIVIAEKFQFSDLIRKEDWLAIWGAFLLILVAATGVVSGLFDFQGAKFNTWGTDENPSVLGAFSGDINIQLIVTFIAFLLLFTIGNKLQHKSAGKFILAFVGLFFLTSVVRVISAQDTFNKYLEYAFWALILGLLIANTVKTPQWLRPALQTEFYIKTGLVLMGAEVLFSNIQKFGLYGLGIAWGVTPIVIIFMWVLGTKVLKIKNNPLVITIAAATSVCGTSAAIATAAASKAHKADLAFAVGTSLIFTVIMMVGMPLFIQAIGLQHRRSGACRSGIGRSRWHRCSPSEDDSEHFDWIYCIWCRNLLYYQGRQNTWSATCWCRRNLAAFPEIYYWFHRCVSRLLICASTNTWRRHNRRHYQAFRSIQELGFCIGIHQHWT